MATPMGEQMVKLRVDQQGDGFTGVMIAPDEEDIFFSSGMIEGARARWKAEVTKPMPMQISFDMVVDGDTLTGTFKPGPFPPAPATAHRI